jgi:hypothetical protein
MVDILGGHNSCITFIPAGHAGGDLITTGEAHCACMERVLGVGAGDAISAFEDAAGELYFSHPTLTGGQTRRELPPANAKMHQETQHRLGMSLVSALVNGRLASFVQHPGSGALFRIRSTYWSPANVPIVFDTMLTDCAGAAGFDPSMIGQPVLLDKQAVEAWAAKSLFPFAVKEEGPTPEAGTRGGGMPPPPWFPFLEKIVAGHRKRADNAAEKGKTLPFPLNRELAARIDIDSGGRWKPSADTVSKHTRKMRKG